MLVLHDAATPAVLAVNVLSSSSLLSSWGALGLFAIVFAETGLLIGFFLPGDSLLFTAGLAASTRAGSALHLPLASVLVAAAAGALAGAQVGYLIGRAAGPPLLERSRSRVLRRGTDRAASLLARYGYGKAIVLARFVPVVRTIANPLAGTLRVPVTTFTMWQAAGGLVWSLGVTLAGYALGSTIPGVDQYLLPAIAVIVILSLLPILIEVRKNRRSAPAGRHAARSSGADHQEELCSGHARPAR